MAHPPLRAAHRGARVPALVLLALLASPATRPATAAPPADGVEVYAEPFFAGAVEAVTLAPGERQRRFSPRFGLGSVLLGENVGILIQRWAQRTITEESPPTYGVLTSGRSSLPDWLTQRNEFVLLFRKGKPRGSFPQGHPDGVAFSERRSGTVVGGVSPEIPMQFYPLGTDTPLAWLRDRDMPWIQVYGSTTWIRLRDQDGQDHVFTSSGQEVAEHNLRYQLPAVPIVHVTVGSGTQGNASPFSTAPPSDERARWVHPQVTFRLAADGRWVEGRPDGSTHVFQEVARTVTWVEIQDPLRGIRLRLQGGGAQMQAAGGAFVVAYPGGGWRDARDFWRVGPAHWFRMAGGTTWEEHQAGRRAFTFAETQRTRDYVEIVDAARGVAVRLHADRAMVLRKDDPSAAWTILGAGRFEREPVPTGGAPPPAPPPPPAPGAPPAAPAPPPAPPAVPDLAGTWRSDLGVEYRFQQSGAAFTWVVGLTGERAEGKATSPDDLTVRWQGPLGSGSATGRITQRDPAGRPIRIQWSNGVVFRR